MNRHLIFISILSTLLLTTLSTVSRAQFCNPQQVTKLLAGDGESYDAFGYVSVSGDIAISGAFLGDSDNGINSGTAYVYRFDGADWIQEGKLIASDGASGDAFGLAVAISGDAAIVGALYDSDNGINAGSAYIFRYDGVNWVEEAKLLASDGASQDNFGWPVAISGDVAVVGSTGDADHGPYSGSAYVFRHDGAGGWEEEDKLLASDAAAEDGFGATVSVSGDVVLVGASLNDDNGTSSGSAYIFRFDGVNWVEEAKLLPIDGSSGDMFGWAGEISGDVAILGSKYDDDNGLDAGSAYIFRYDGTAWTQEAKLLAADGAGGDGFGHAVSISGDMAVAGAPNDADNGTQSGSAYLFHYDGTAWTQRSKILAADNAGGDMFGISVSVSGGAGVAGAVMDDDKGTDSGSAYVFNLNCATLTVSPDPLIAGENGTFTVATSNPNSPTFLAYSLAGTGTFYVPPLDVILDIQSPAQAGTSVMSDSTGTAEWVIPIPAGGAGHSVWVQALQFQTKTNVVATSME